jgi:hypothetical protein
VTGPRVYKAINAVARELGRVGIPKTNFNSIGRYQYRSIDDVLHGLSPLLAKHRLCALPRVLERTSVERVGLNGSYRSMVSLKIAYDLVSAQDASIHTIEIFGEAHDDSDKATARAMSSAFKSAMLQAFCIPVSGSDYPDSPPTKVEGRELQPAPVQGWDHWADDIKEMVSICVSREALSRVQDQYRDELQSLSRERPELFRAIGSAFGAAKSRILNIKPPRPPGEQSPNAEGPASKGAKPASLAVVSG